jgi:hypothetical protein
MADKDFKVKNGLIVGDSATIGSKLTVDGAIVVGGAATITGNTTFEGNVTIDGNFSGSYTGFDSDFGDKTTTDLTEGDNLYYTTARHDSDTLAQVDSAFLDKLAKDYVTKTDTQTLTNKTIVDPIIDSTPVYGREFGSLSINEDAMYGDATQTVLNLTSDSGGADAVLSLGVKDAFRHAIGVTGTSGSNTMVVGFEGTDTELKIKNNVGSSPFALDGGTDLVTMTSAGRFDFKNATEATTKTTASVVLRGGLGVDKNIRAQDIIANNITANGTLTGALAASSLSGRSTSDLSEGTNLYYLDTRVDSYINASILTTDVSEGTNLYYTTARADSAAKRAISVSDAGGDGSLTYNNGTGVITYTGPSAAEVRAHFSAGTGVTITNGSIAIGQAVATTDSAEFSGLTISGNANITGDLVVGGDYILNETTDLRVTNGLIKLADSNSNDTVDIGVIGRYSQDGGSTIRRAGFFRDASNGEWYTFTNLIQDAFDSAIPPTTINRGDASFELGTWNFGALRGRYLGFDSDFRVFSTDYTVYDSDFTAVSAGRYAIDTTNNTVTVTLPSNPTTGDYIKLIDVGDWTANSVTVGRNGSTIEGYSEDFELDLGQSVIEFIYINNSWQLYSSIGQRGEQGPKGDSADAADFASQAQSIAFSVALG